MKKTSAISVIMLFSIWVNALNIDSLKNHLSKLKDDTIKANQLNSLAKELCIDSPIEATQLAYDALSLSDSLQYSIGIVKSTRVLADVEWYKNNYPKSLEYYLKALLKIEKELEQNKTEENYKLAAMLVNDVAMVYQTEHEYDKAISELNKGFKYAQASNDDEIIADYTFGFAVLFNNMDQTDSALVYYDRALKINQRIEDLESISKCYNNIASIYNDVGRHTEALPYFYKAYEIDSIRDYKRGLARLKLNIGGTFFFMDQEEKGLKIIYQGVEMCKKLGRRKLLSKAYFYISEMHEKRGEYPQALELYKLHTSLKDSLFNESKSKEIGKLEAQYEIEKKQEDELRAKNEQLRIASEQKSRRDNLQFSGIFVFVLILFAFVFMSGKFAMSEKLAEGLIFFTFLLFFEFCLVLLDPVIDLWSAGEPLYKLIFNAILAGAIFPLHSFFETTLKKRLIK